jgi:hypothetical protein
MTIDMKDMSGKILWEKGFEAGVIAAVTALENKVELLKTEHDQLYALMEKGLQEANADNLNGICYQFAFFQDAADYLKESFGI